MQKLTTQLSTWKSHAMTGTSRALRRVRRVAGTLTVHSIVQFTRSLHRLLRSSRNAPRWMTKRKAASCPRSSRKVTWSKTPKYWLGLSDSRACSIQISVRRSSTWSGLWRPIRWSTLALRRTGAQRSCKTSTRGPSSPGRRRRLPSTGKITRNK